MAVDTVQVVLVGTDGVDVAVATRKATDLSGIEKAMAPHLASSDRVVIRHATGDYNLGWWREVVLKQQQEELLEAAHDVLLDARHNLGCYDTWSPALKRVDDAVEAIDPEVPST